MFKAFLVKYAEIGIKGKNRYLFEDALIRQMEYVCLLYTSFTRCHRFR